MTYEQTPQGHPSAHPFATPDKPRSTWENRPTGAANDSAAARSTTSSARARSVRRVRDVDQIIERLSQRDLAILRSVAEHQFLTVPQVEALHFSDHAETSGPRIARRTLARLRDLRVLGTLDRHIGGLGAGSEGLVHYVDTVGQQVLTGRPGRNVRRFHEPSRRFLRHRLAIADARLSLLKAHRAELIELVDSTVEPGAWRHYVGLGGARLTPKPDLYAETASPPGSDMVHAWFVEIDLGTESITTLLRKCRAYESYRQSGVEQTRSGGFPLVVWSVSHTDEKRGKSRRAAFLDAIAHDRSLTAELFRVVRPDELVPTLLGGGQS